VEKNRNRSFVEVVTGTSQEEWKGLTINTHHNVPKWLANNFVGTLCAEMDFDKLEEEIVKGGMSMVRVCFMGDNLILLSPSKGEDLANLMKQNSGWFESVFSSVSPWSFRCGASYRCVWVRCFGVPLPVWNKDCFTKVIGAMSREAEVVVVDEDTLSWEVVEFARVNIRVQNIGSVRWARRIQINGHRCSVLVEEEPIDSLEWGCKENLSWEASSNCVSSSETYVEETAFSKRSGDDGRGEAGEEGGGNKNGEGEHLRLKATLPLMETGKGGQGKGRLFVPSSARQGHKGQYGNMPDISLD